MATVERSNIEHLNDKLTVKLTKEDYLPAFEKKLKEYGKNANIPGFRKGHVPAGMIKKMYGPSIFSDEVLRTIEKELAVYLDKERPDIFAQPLPMSEEMSRLDMNDPGDFEFSFEIGLKPEYKLPDLSAAALTRNKVSISAESVEEDVDRIRMKGGSPVEKDAADNDDDSVTIIYTKQGEDANSHEDGAHKEISNRLAHLASKLKEKVTGMKAGDSFSFQLNEMFEGDDLTNMQRELGAEGDNTNESAASYRAEIKSVTRTEPRSLDDETFYGEIFPGRAIADAQGFRDAMRQDMEKYWEGQTKNQLHDQIYHLLLDGTQMEFPQQFLTRWLKTGGDKERTQEEAETEYPTFQNQLKWTLISDRIIRENKLEVSEEELREQTRKELAGYFGQMNLDGDTSWLDAYIDRMMKDEKQVDAVYRRIITEKLFDWAEAQAKPSEATVTPEEFGKMQHNH